MVPSLAPDGTVGRRLPQWCIMWAQTLPKREARLVRYPHPAFTAPAEAAGPPSAAVGPGPVTLPRSRGVTGSAPSSCCPDPSGRRDSGARRRKKHKKKHKDKAEKGKRT